MLSNYISSRYLLISWCRWRSFLVCVLSYWRCICACVWVRARARVCVTLSLYSILQTDTSISFAFLRVLNRPKVRLIEQYYWYYTLLIINGHRLTCSGYELLTGLARGFWKTVQPTHNDAGMAFVIHTNHLMLSGCNFINLAQSRAVHVSVVTRQ